MKDFDHLVYYLILYMYAFTDHSTGKNHTVFDHGILVDNAATTENGILNGSLHLTAVGNDRVADLGGLIIVSRTCLLYTSTVSRGYSERIWTVFPESNRCRYEADFTAT